MSTTTIRVSMETRNALNELAANAGISMQLVIDRALELYRRQQMLAALNHAYAALQEDEASWAAWQAEQAEWDVTLEDGLATT